MTRLRKLLNKDFMRRNRTTGKLLKIYIHPKLARRRDLKWSWGQMGQGMLVTLPEGNYKRVLVIVIWISTLRVMVCIASSQREVLRLMDPCLLRINMLRWRLVEELDLNFLKRNEVLTGVKPKRKILLMINLSLNHELIILKKWGKTDGPKRLITLKPTLLTPHWLPITTITIGLVMPICKV